MLLISRHEEIELASMIIALYSAIDQHVNTFENISTILKNGSTIDDQTSKRHVEEGYGQLNISDILNQPNFILTSASYSNYRLNHDLALLPNIHTVKTRYGNSLLMMLLISPWSDLNVTELHEAANELCKNFNGVFRRGSVDIARMKISAKKRRFQCEKASQLLLQGLYHRIFSDRSMRGTPKKFRKTGNLIAILFQEGILSALIQCFGECGHVYRPENIQRTVCPSCGGKLGWAPPVFQPKKIAIAYPNDLLRLETQNIRSYLPIDLLFLYQASDLPSQVRLMLNRINSRIFQSGVPFLEEAIFETVYGQDFLYLYNISKQKDDRILMITAICDSRFQGSSTIPTMIIRALIRTLCEGKIMKYNYQKIPIYPIIKTWNFSDWIGISKKSGDWEQLLSWKNLSSHQQDLSTFSF